MVRSDVVELWRLYRGLKSEQKRHQFLQAAAKWQEALMLDRDKETLSFALKIVACEALKPSGAAYNDHNIYDVLEAPLGKPAADRLRQPQCPAQRVRNAHLHAGVFQGAELVRRAFLSSFQASAKPTANLDI